MFERIEKFCEENHEYLRNAMLADPERFCLALLEANSKLFSLNEEIPGIVPMDGPAGMVFYPNFKNMSVA